MFYRGTTPPLRFTVRKKDLTQMQEIYLTFKQGRIEITKKSADLEQIEVDANGDSHFICRLTQEDTLSFQPNLIEIQIRGIDDDGNVAFATKIRTDSVKRILKDGVLTGD